MAPKATYMETMHALQSFMLQAHTQKYSPESISKDVDPVAAKLDNMGTG
jgi:hypothetical protein